MSVGEGAPVFSISYADVCVLLVCSRDYIYLLTPEEHSPSL